MLAVSPFSGQWDMDVVNESDDIDRCWSKVSKKIRRIIPGLHCNNLKSIHNRLSEQCRSPTRCGNQQRPPFDSLLRVER